MLPQGKTFPFGHFHFIVIGVGGTGGHLVPNLVRMLSFIKDQPHKLTLIDGDTVEPKNIGRQNFVTDDVGSNKAEVLATRYGGAFEFEIGYFDKYIENADELINLVAKDYLPVFVGCVDNNRTRQMVKEAFDKLTTCIWLDSGNEEFAGQVVFGAKWNDKVMLDPVTTLHPEIVTDTTTKYPTELTCEEHAISAPQNIRTNVTAATLLFGFCGSIAACEEIMVNEVAFNSAVNTFTTKWAPGAELKPVIVAKKETIPVADIVTAPRQEDLREEAVAAHIRGEDKEAVPAK